MNCPALGGDDADCKCGLQYRIALQTEQTMHAAWRKRAEEAEALLASVHAAWHEADRQRLSETHKCCEEAERWRIEHDDMFGWNFHRGVASGTVWASLYYDRVRREFENKARQLPPRPAN